MPSACHAPVTDLRLFVSPQSQQASNSSDRNELEKQMRLELNAKLVEVNNFLAEQEKARDDIDRLRDSREADMRKNFENSRRALEVSPAANSHPGDDWPSLTFTKD